ncbi:MAG: glycosyl hydrolase 115 family protein [Lachnospiraceae bacterium]|nr:glycosyl hydrolase 115 family protein [Lachnospiraceae bacterium]
MEETMENVQFEKIKLEEKRCGEGGFDGFRIDRRTAIESEFTEEAVKRAEARFYRDLEMTLENPQENASSVILLKKSPMEPEAYRIHAEPGRLTVEAGEELGAVYALLFVSRRFLGVEPFWFWNDQTFVKRSEAGIPSGWYLSEKKPVAYRGWFINDEVLLSHWDGGRDETYPWEMAFEALLRCGGNVVIPGTDRNSKKYAALASSMGLWITHHHAEPLGAEMFLRAYPALNPSFREHPDLFRGLWEEGIKRQLGEKVIWNLGFRGQGDTPFWEHDPMYDTPEKRGALISSILEEQYALIQKYVPDPVCSTNLYGETMELYQQGFLRLPEQVILIWADNGYGKMVSRRQGNHNPRIPALPEPHLKNGSHGVYYHVSFYDLQAANVLTMIPNSMEFVEKELRNGYQRGIQKLWLINCSNIKPHVYPLDFAASLWNGEGLEPEAHLRQYLKRYYGSDDQEMQRCFQDYFSCTLPYGKREDEHAGEQFYNYVLRVLLSGWMRDGGRKPCEELLWCGPKESFGQQLRWFAGVCEAGEEGFSRLLLDCEQLAKQTDRDRLWKDSLLLQVRLHVFCIRGVLKFAKAYEEYEKADYFQAFYRLGQAADWFQAAQEAMMECEHDKWKGFYDNDCQTDVKETAYLLRLLMGYVRNLGDGPYFYQWQRQVIYAEEDRRVVLLTNEENHLTDAQLYQAMKRKRLQENVCYDRGKRLE